MWFPLKVINIRQVGQMNYYTSERLTHGEATLLLEAIHPVSESAHDQRYDNGNEVI